MRDHRIVKLRFLFATLYCAILAWLFPGLWNYIWLIPLAGLMPVIATASPCLSICNSETQTSEILLELSGIANSTCTDCANLNRTVVLPFLGTCLYFLNSSGVTICGASRTVTYRYDWSSAVAGGVLLDTNVPVPSDNQVAAWDPIGAGLRDCGVSVVISAPPDVVTGTAHCDFSLCLATATPQGSIV